MKRSFLFLPGALLALTLGVVGPAPAAAQDNDRDNSQYYPGGSLDAHRHGYEHGYRDGYEMGVNARAQRTSLDFHTDAYRDAMRGFRPEFGSADAFRDGYREGYQAGAQDGFGGVRSRLEQTFGWRGGYNADTPSDTDDSRAYREHRWNYQDVASDVGYRDGVNAGLRDMRNGMKSDPDSHQAWQTASHGWSPELGERQAYRDAYRTAYEAGYRDGYNGRGNQ